MIDSSDCNFVQSPHQIFTAEFAVAAAHERTACHYAEIREIITDKTIQIKRNLRRGVTASIGTKKITRKRFNKLNTLNP